MLNFTFVFPNNPQVISIEGNYTLYQIDPANKTNPQIRMSFVSNCSASAPCLSSAVPQVVFNPGSFVIGCFQWMYYDANGTDLGSAYDCTLGQTTVNSTQLPAVSLMQDPPEVTNDTITIYAYFPASSPYDQVNISSVLDNSTLPTVSSPGTNATFTAMNMFVYTNLMPNTVYNACTTVTCGNSVIRGSQTTEVNCQTITTSANPSANNSAKITVANLCLIILLFLVSVL